MATEGPLGFWTIGWLRYHGLRFTTSFHTRYAEYLNARLPVPLEWGYRLVRWFHARAQHTLVSSMSLLRELEEKRVGHHLVHWPRGDPWTTISRTTRLWPISAMKGSM